MRAEETSAEDGSDGTDGAGATRDTQRRRTTAAALIVIIGAAAVSRLLGITWGLSGPTHLFSYHPDEFFSLRAALNTLLFQDLNPDFFNYPSLYLYLAAAACSAGHGASAIGAEVPDLPGLLRSFTLDARLMTVLLSLGTVGVTYAVAARLAGRQAGLLAAGILAVAPGHVLYSHFAAVDVALALFTTLSALGSVALLSDVRLKTVLLTGLAVGAAAATKYNGSLALIMPLVALGIRFTQSPRERRRAEVGRAVIVVLTATLAFCVLSPYVLLDWGTASRDILYERAHMRQGEYPANAADPNGWFFHLRALGYGLGGSAPLALGLVLSALGMRRRWPQGLPLLAFAFVWFAVIGATGVRYARYGIPLLPLLAAGASLGVAYLGERRPGPWASGAGTLLVLPALLTSAGLSGSMALEPEPRDSALKWIEQHVAGGDRVGVARSIWFDMPPLDYNNGADALGDSPLWTQFRRPKWPLVTVPNFDASLLSQEQPKWFVESDFQFDEWLRAGDRNAIAFRETLERHYEIAGLFQRRLSWHVLGPCGPVPHDYSYPFTRIRVWRLSTPEDSAPQRGT